MEFYSKALNSRSKEPKVSIPNGMEFYDREIETEAGKKYGFNSQRDGILRASKIRITFFLVWFQFPTGWNSTKTIEKHY